MPRYAPDPSNYTLYGADFSLFTRKLRSYLRKKGIPHQQRLSSLWTYRKFIQPRTGVAYIPVLQTPDDEVWQDTTVIIDQLEQRFPNNPAYPEAPVQHLAGLILELFGDEFLLIPAMHHRWNHPENVPSMHAKFGRMAVPWLPGVAQRMVGKSLAARFSGFLPALGITEATEVAIDEWYEGLLSELEQHFSHHRFLLGDSPTVADFGFAGPFIGHLAQDPWPAEHLRKTAPAVVSWVERMDSDEQFEPALPADDAIADTLLPVLRRWATDQLPLLLDSATRLGQWAETHADGDKVPRSIGTHELMLNGATASRRLTTYPIWMYQRPLDHYRSLTDSQRQQADQLLAAIGAERAFADDLPVRLQRRNNRLCLDRQR